MRVSLLLALLFAASDSSEHAAPMQSLRVQVVFVSTEDEFLPDPTMPPSLVQLSSAGQFSSDGMRLKDLGFLFVQDERERKRKTPVYVMVDLANEKETPLPT